VLGKAALVPFREDQPPVRHDVVLAAFARDCRRLVSSRLVDRARETRGPGVVAVSDGAVEDLDPHPMETNERDDGHEPRSDQMSSTPFWSWSLALPSGSAILPSATIGLFQ
jgi:hypothetical protein